ncbi:hypothetical protein BD324DRAFT_637776 [Kockovaella imperatae]|uniref:CFEM domain-containing protein n=1 Tax=Kockovaella imperatae TaxID=4999 RepID=A0A1Y1U7E2_9TREE|nr:hypothetical protein BD324DRAFT_637776 [Kockovaella imperatae]ORX33951.1 hypothetical protein BD324DRAFT_637776 [Kockovaella imperatae]
MAPSYVEGIVNLSKRQSAIPACVTTCMGAGNITGCASSIDYTCLCQSSPFLDSVTSCWQATCNATSIQYGIEYATKACAAFGINLNATVGNTTPAVDVDGDPVLFQKAFMNVQAIMSSICAALFAVAIVLGILACRKRVKIDRETAQRSTWTGVGGTTTLNGAESKGPSRFGISRNAGVNSRHDGLDPNFDITSMTTLRYGQSSYGGINRDPMVPSLNRTGFTNRLTLGDMGEEEWEMDSKQSGSGTPVKIADSPTSTSTRMGASTVDLVHDGSTVELNGRAM